MRSEREENIEVDSFSAVLAGDQPVRFGRD
jgi:hypothetical protein